MTFMPSGSKNTPVKPKSQAASAVWPCLGQKRIDACIDADVDSDSTEEDVVVATVSVTAIAKPTDRCMVRRVNVRLAGCAGLYHLSAAWQLRRPFLAACLTGEYGRNRLKTGFYLGEGLLRPNCFRIASTKLFIFIVGRSPAGNNICIGRLGPS